MLLFTYSQLLEFGFNHLTPCHGLSLDQHYRLSQGFIRLALGCGHCVSWAWCEGTTVALWRPSGSQRSKPRNFNVRDKQGYYVTFTPRARSPRTLPAPTSVLASASDPAPAPAQAVPSRKRGACDALGSPSLLPAPPLRGVTSPLRMAPRNACLPGSVLAAPAPGSAQHLEITDLLPHDSLGADLIAEQEATTDPELTQLLSTFNSTSGESNFDFSAALFPELVGLTSTAEPAARASLA
jgi:hypothetical protein